MNILQRLWTAVLCRISRDNAYDDIWTLQSAIDEATLGEDTPEADAAFAEWIRGMLADLDALDDAA